MPVFVYPSLADHIVFGFCFFLSQSWLGMSQPVSTAHCQLGPTDLLALVQLSQDPVQLLLRTVRLSRHSRTLAPQRRQLLAHLCRLLLLLLAGLVELLQPMTGCHQRGLQLQDTVNPHNKCVNTRYWCLCIMMVLS
jgi:hypothetical protein